MTEKNFYSMAEVADLLGVSYKTIMRMIKRGEIPFRKVGCQVRIPRSYVEQMEVA